MNNKPIEGLSLILLTISLSLGIFMNVLDSSIANVAIPAISGDIGVSPNQGTWVITSFAVSCAIVIPLTGWLARRFGEVRLFVAATFLFTVASMLCGLSRSLPMLIVFRVMQGAVAGPMIPLSQSLLLAHYPADKKGLATALWAMVAVVAPIVGPILGGWLTDNYSWPWIFYINLPVGLFSAYFTWLLLRDHETVRVRQPIDAVGLGLLIMGIGCLQVFLDKGKDLDWFNSNVIVALAVIVVVSLTFLVIWEITAEFPVIDLNLFKRRNFTIGAITLSVGYMAFFGNIVILPLWLQTQMGYTATWAGFAAAPIGILPLFLSPIVGKNINKLDLRLLAAFSFVVFAVISFWNMGFNTQVSFMQIAVPRFIQGVALACFFIPLISISISGLEPQHIASALGLANFLRILGGGVGTSLTLTLWDRRATLHHAQLTENITSYSNNTHQILQQINNLGLHGPPAYKLIDNIISNQAYMLATNDFFFFVGWLFMSLFVLVWFAKPPFTQSGGAASAGAH